MLSSKAPNCLLKKVVNTTIKMQGNVVIQLERRLIKHTKPTFLYPNRLVKQFAMKRLVRHPDSSVQERAAETFFGTSKSFFNDKSLPQLISKTIE